jgi:hypothetical protein
LPIANEVEHRHSGLEIGSNILIVKYKLDH